MQIKLMNFILAIKSSTLEVNTAYNFIRATLQKKDRIKINMVFFFQNGTDILLDHENNKQWSHLLINNNLLGSICPASCNKRGINSNNIPAHFKKSSIIEFINLCDTADRVIHF